MVARVQAYEADAKIDSASYAELNLAFMARGEALKHQGTAVEKSDSIATNNYMMYLTEKKYSHSLEDKNKKQEKFMWGAIILGILIALLL